MLFSTNLQFRCPRAPPNGRRLYEGGEYTTGYVDDERAIPHHRAQRHKIIVKNQNFFAKKRG